MRKVYLDNNATTPLHPEVKKIMCEAMDFYGNASSMHAFGRQSKKYIEDAREMIAGYIHADPDELIFLGSGSEANNTVLNIFSCSLRSCPHGSMFGNGILTSKIEHPCILETAKCFGERGIKIFFVSVDSYGKIDMNELENILATETIGLVSIMMANNEIGTVQNIKDISRLVHSYSAFMHTDAVQALGKIPVDVKDLGVDFLSLSAHKAYGPKGIGVLYIKKGTPFCPLIHGGHQEKGRRAGTENSLGIVGFGKAVEMLQADMKKNIDKISFLKEKLKKSILSSIPNAYLNGHPEDVLPNTLNISFKGAEGESVLLYLDLEGIAVSTGSACSSGSLDPSHVLLSIGLDAEMAHGSIRFSLGRETSEEDIDYVCQKLPEVIDKIRKMSTAY